MCSWHLLTLELWMIVYIYQAKDKSIWIQLQPDVACDQSTIWLCINYLSKTSINQLPLFSACEKLDLEKLSPVSCLGLLEMPTQMFQLAQEVTRGGRQNLHGIYTPQGRSFVRNKNAGDLLRMPWDVRNEGRDILDTTGYYFKKMQIFHAIYGFNDFKEMIFIYFFPKSLQGAKNSEVVDAAWDILALEIHGQILGDGWLVFSPDDSLPVFGTQCRWCFF